MKSDKERLKELACEAIDILFKTEQVAEKSDVEEMYDAAPQDPIQQMYDQPVQEVEQPSSVPEASQPAQSIPDVDIRGIKWDERIHQSSRKRNKNGQWANKRGVDKKLLTQVEAELIEAAISEAKQEPTQPVPAPPQPTIDVQPTPEPEPVMQAPVQPVATPEVVQPSQDYGIIPTPKGDPTKPMHSLQTFKANLINILAELTNDGTLTPEYMQQLKEYFGVGELWQIFNDDQKVETLFDNFCDIGYIVKVA